MNSRSKKWFLKIFEFRANFFQNFVFVFLFFFAGILNWRLTVSAVALQMMLLLLLVVLLLVVVVLLVLVVMVVRTGQLPAIVTRDDGALIGRGRSGRAATTTAAAAAVIIIITIDTSRLYLERFGADGRRQG